MKKTFKKIIVPFSVFLIFMLPFCVLADDTTQYRGAGGLVPCAGPECQFTHFVTLVVNVVKFLIELGIAFSVIVFAYAGFLYLTAGGDSGKISEAHGLFVKVLWGFLFALGAFLIVELITSQLGLKPGIIIFGI